MYDFVPFDDLLENVVDNRGRTAPTTEQGIPLIATNCVKPDSMYPVFEKVRYVTEETYRSWFRGHPEPGDILFVTKGSPGRTSLVPDPVDFCIAQDMVALRADPKRIYPKFLFALLRSESTLAAIDGLHVGTLIPHFKKGDFGRLILPIPDRSTQEVIGDTYFELSEKIDLNRQMNQTLDEIARTFFRSWFVDFDPVRAKAEGRQPEGMDADTATLFPDRLVDSELGPIPESWDAVSVYDLANVVYGASFASSSFRTDGCGVPLLRIRDLATNNPGIFTEEIHPRATLVKPGDLVVGMDGEFRAHLWTGPDSFLNQRLCKFDAIGCASRAFIRCAIEEPLSFYERSKTGTTVIHLGKSDIDRFRLLRPSQPVLKEFAHQSEPLLNLLVANALEGRTLAEVRDTLLAELLSGKLQA